MLRTFKAILKGNQLQWLEEVPEESDTATPRYRERPVEVYVTLLEEDSSSRQQKIAEVLEKLAESNPFAGVDAVEWQREIRCDRPLPSSRAVSF